MGDLEVIMDSWKPVSGPKGSIHGLAICNYNVCKENVIGHDNKEEASWHLNLFVGDMVVIMEECRDWFYGHVCCRPGMCGVFPRSHISLISTNDAQKVPEMVHEITAALREWNTILKQAFLKPVNEKQTIQAIMKEVMIMRSTLISGKLTVEEAKETRHKVTTKMDFLNHRLGLDLVVRDAQGHVLSPDNVSAVSLYRHHVTASEKITNMMVANPRDEVEMTNTFKIMLSVKNFFCYKLTESLVDLIISIYEVSDGKTPKPLCENFVMENWSLGIREALSSERAKAGLKCQFGDISKNDITNKRLFLICNVVSNGNFGSKLSEADKRQASKLDLRGAEDLNFRKPVGVAATEITDLFTFKQGKTAKRGREVDIVCPFLLGNECESLETTFRKLVHEKKVTESKTLSVVIGIVFGSDIMDTHSYYHHQQVLMTLSGRANVAQKLGLPEIILPTEVRNDLYVTIVSGEFSRLDKLQDRNVEATLEVVDADGKVVEGCVSGGVAGYDLLSRYRTIVYYHDGKPRWNEVVRVSVPSDAFAGTHLRFTFRHRSRNESKDKLAPPWAMAFLKLVSDKDGTAVQDSVHELCVYKLDKKYEPSCPESSYLKLPHLKLGQAMKQSSSKNQPSHPGISLIAKDSFTVQTTLASTKLTQNEGLLSLLKWKSEPQRLERNLQIFDQKVNGNEFVKFMPDVLDALFSILMENPESEKYDDKVFKSLVKVVHMITEDTRYSQFIPVLEMYINESFYATLAYSKLLIVLRECADNAATKASDLNKPTKCLKYIFKFIVRSRSLCSQLNQGQGQDLFRQQLEEVLRSLIKLMASSTEDLHQAQAFCLKNMVASVPDLVQVYSKRSLAEVVVQMLSVLPLGQLVEHKLATVKELVQSQLFSESECREVMIPCMAQLIKFILAKFYDKAHFVSLAIDTLGDVLSHLSDLQSLQASVMADVSVLTKTCLRSLIQCVAQRRMVPQGASRRAIVANLIALLRMMSPQHYEEYIGILNEDTCELSDFVMQVLELFKDLLQNSMFPADWNSMIMLQNSVLLGGLCQFSHCIRDFLSSPFKYEVWFQFFQCAILFITHPSLQVERFSETKKNKILSQYKDMRKEMGMEVRQMWFNLGQHKIKFVPVMVGNFLELTMIPEAELRKASIPIFFDMMQCEYYSSRAPLMPDVATDSSRNRDSSMIKANFEEFEAELITKLDLFIAECGCGDGHYLFLFKSILQSHCDNHTLLRDLGLDFVKMISRLIELLLQYRSISLQDSKENLMSCCVHLLEFFCGIGRQDLYIKYLKKLAQLHLQCHNYAEAGYTFLQYANLLKWSDEPLLLYTWSRYPHCTTHRDLKESLYKEVIANFEQGEIWESAIDICKVLMHQYMEQSFNYHELARLLQDMSTLYTNIMTRLRPPPEYFRVAFYGRGFPAFLQNKVFVYRGKGYERLSDFKTRMLEQFPNAELMTSLKPPSDEEKENPNQFLQINAVDPKMEEKAEFRGKLIQQQILNFYKYNHVNQFSYSRPFHKDKEPGENEFASLWIERTVLTTSSTFPGILPWISVDTRPRVYELSPLEVAIETMEKTNDDLRALIFEFQDGNPPLNPLTMKLNGIIDAAVMGGTVNYERAFFTDKYLSSHPEDEDLIATLKDQIATQIPLLQHAIEIHSNRISDDLKPLQDRLEAMFKTMKSQVEEKYGKRRSDISLKVLGSQDSFTDEESSTMVIQSHLQTGTPVSLSSRSQLQPGRSLAHSQVNLDTSSSALTATSRVLSAIRLPRRKSNANPISEDNRLRVSCGNSPAAIHDNGHASLAADDSLTRSSASCALSPLQQNLTSGRLGVICSRPSSGQFLHVTSTPNHSRSPSITSNRDSFHSNDGILDVPPVPPKSRSDDGPDLNTWSCSVSDISSALGMSKKKRAPPPPPCCTPSPPTPPPLPPPTPPKKPASRACDG